MSDFANDTTLGRIRVALAWLDAAADFAPPKLKQLYAMRAIMRGWKTFAHEYHWAAHGRDHQQMVGFDALVQTRERATLRGVLRCISVTLSSCENIEHIASLANLKVKSSSHQTAARSTALPVDRFTGLSGSDIMLVGRVRDQLLDIRSRSAAERLWAVLQRWRAVGAMTEAFGTEARTRERGGESVTYRIEAGVGGCWAANLAMLGDKVSAERPNSAWPLVGVFSRQMFRVDVAPDRLRALFLAGLLRSAEQAVRDVREVRAAVLRADAVLGARTARSRLVDALLFIHAVGPMRRSDLARAFSVTSRAASLLVGEMINHGLAVDEAGLVRSLLGRGMPPVSAAPFGVSAPVDDEVAQAIAFADGVLAKYGAG